MNGMERRTAVRLVTTLLALLVPSLFVLDRARAGGDHFYPPVNDPVVAEECGGCHLAFSPAMLPARSWQAMMANLEDHFGDDASLSPPTVAHIERYLVERAADAGGARYASRLLRGVTEAQTPLRITTLPRWEREHREVTRAEWADPKVGSKANCAACHRDAERGYFDDD